MFKIFAKLPRFAIVISIVGLTALAAWAGTAVNVTASLADTCPNCRTDTGAFTIDDYWKSGPRPYSLVADDFGAYTPSTGVQSQILTHNNVYTLDTSATLVDGLVAPTTRTVRMHYFSSVECGRLDPTCEFPNNILPPCWEGNYDQNQAVNWSIFAPVSFLLMSTSTSAKYQGMARLNFNVRGGACDDQINRFRLEWPVVCITPSVAGGKIIGWTVTSQACSGSTVNWGEAHLQAYGGKKGNTVDYGDWRMPFVLTLKR